MSDEEMAAFFKAHPERAVEMAKIATSFQGAAEKISAPAEANSRAAKSATPTLKRRRLNPGDIVDADAADLSDDGPVDKAPQQQRRKSSSSSSKPPTKPVRVESVIGRPRPSLTGSASPGSNAAG